MATNIDFIEHYKTLPSQISYNNNEEYRRYLRTVFRLDPNKITPYSSLNLEDIYKQSEIDEESRDEMEFDPDTLDKNMEILFKKTYKIYDFKEIYILAAARMFSTDIKIGQAVLCSYDTFSLYHTCIWYILVDPFMNIETITEYNELLKYFK